MTNIVDEGDHFSIIAELPGLEKGDIEITVRDGNLEIKGDQKNEVEEKKEPKLYIENQPIPIKRLGNNTEYLVLTN